MPESTGVVCPLCHGKAIGHYLSDKRRDYLRCAGCDLVFVPPKQHLSPVEEKAHYDLHENDPVDAGYRRFLSRLADPMLACLPTGAAGLDFGAGPGPTLSRMFAEAGHPTAIYDCYYANDPSVLEKTYDFVTASEVVEHLAEPGDVLQQLWSLLRPGGWLGLMTKRVTDREAFARWHYKNDPTHISFFSRATFEFLGERWGASPHFPHPDVVLFRKY